MNNYKCRKIISINRNEDLMFHSEIYNKIINQVSDNLPIVVLSIIGPYRTGKSFLLNLITDFLIKKSNTFSNLPNIFRDSVIPQYFRSSYGNNPVTDEVYMYQKPIILDFKGTKTAFFILDTPGLFDTRTSQKATVKLFGIISIISSWTIYNIPNRIQEDHLQNIALFSEYSKLAQDSVKPLQHLDILVRDFQCFDEIIDNGYFQYCDNYFKKIMRADEMDVGLYSTRECIINSYNSISCHLMPHPGFKVMGKNFKFSKKDVNEDFMSTFQKYMNNLLNNISVKKIYKQIITTSNLENTINTIIQTFNNTSNSKLPPTLTLLQAIKECQLNQLYQKCINIYCNDFQKFINKSYRLEYRMGQHHLLNKSTVIKYFNSFHIEIPGNSDKFKNYKVKLDKELDKYFAHYQMKNTKNNPCKKIQTYLTYPNITLGTIGVNMISRTCSESINICSYTVSTTNCIVLIIILNFVYNIYLLVPGKVKLN